MLSLNSASSANQSTSPLSWLALIAVSVALGLAVSQSILVLAGLFSLLCVIVWLRVTGLPSPSVLAVVVLLFVTMAGLFSNRSDGYQTDVTAVIQDIESGNLGNRIAFPLFFVIGFYFILQRPSHVLRLNLAPWLVLYVLFLCLSVVWSWDPALTLRRISIPVCVVSFGFGIGAVYFGSKPDGYVALTRITVWTSSTVSLMVIAASILHGDLRVTDPLWRLGREGAENLTAWVFGVGFLMMWATWSRTDIWPNRREKLLHASLLGSTLLLTKSRTTLMAVFLGVASIEWLRVRYSGQGAFRLVGFLTCLLAGGLILMVTPAYDALWARGNAESMDTLSGRVPLWESLWSILSEHLWFGLGFGAFWSPKTVQAFASHWTPTATHNGYLELVADVGVVGLGGSILIVALSLRNGVRLLKYPLYREIAAALVALIVADMVVSLGMSWYLERFQEYPSMVILGLSIYVAHRLSFQESRGASQ